MPKSLCNAPVELLTLGDHIKQKRLEKELFQKDLAKIFDVDIITIFNWESGKSQKIPVSMYPEIVKFLNYCPVEYFKHEGQKLAAFRKYRGLTQKKLAKMLGSDESYLCRWETNKRKIPYEKIQTLQKIFNYTFKSNQPSYQCKIPKELITIGDHLKTKRLEKRLSVKKALKYFSITASSTYRNWEDQKDINISAKYYPEIVAFLAYCPIETFTTQAEQLTLTENMQD